MLQLVQVTKLYNHVTVLKNFDLTVHRGQTICISGKRFSGKTTLLDLCIGFQDVNSGHISIDGELLTPTLAKEKIAYIADERVVKEKLTPVEYLHRVAAIAGFKLTDQLAQVYLAGFDLPSALLDTTMDNYDKINRLRVYFAGAVAKNNSYILLDEPDRGMNANELDTLTKLITKLNELNFGVLMTGSGFGRYDTEVLKNH